MNDIQRRINLLEKERNQTFSQLAQIKKQQPFNFSISTNVSVKLKQKKRVSSVISQRGEAQTLEKINLITPRSTIKYNNSNLLFTTPFQKTASGCDWKFLVDSNI